MISKIRRKLMSLLRPTGGTTERAVKSGVWSGLNNAVTRAIQLLKVIILARLIPPADFGILGIGFLVLAVFKHFSNIGVGAALVQREEENVDKHLNTAWILRIVRGLLITVVGILVAPFAASVFGEPRATPVIRVLSLSSLMIGLRNPGIIYFTKELQFHKRFIQRVSGTIINFIIAVILGVLLQNVWALVAGSVAGSITSLVVSYIIHDYRPSLDFDLTQATELFDYGKWILGSTSIFFLLRQGDDAFVGWYLGATALGFYQMAYRFSNAPATELTQVLSTVTFPTYSQVQNDQSKLKKGFYRTARLGTFISFPMAAGIAVVAPLFVPVFLGQDWLPIITVMQILAGLGLIRSIRSISGALFDAVGRPDIPTKVQLGELVIMILLLFPLTERFDLAGTGIAVLIGGLLPTPISAYLGVRIVNGSLSKFARIMLLPAASSALMAVSLWLLYQLMSTGILAVDFLIAFVLGILVYLVATWIAIKTFDYQVLNELDIIRRNLS